MSIHKKWSGYTRENALSEPDTYGVYEIGDFDTGAILYIGEGKIKTGLLSHCPDGGNKKHVSIFGTSVVGTYGYRFEQALSKSKARQRQKELLKEFKKTYGSMPRFNQRKERTLTMALV